MKLPISVNQVVYDSGASLCYLPTKEFKALITEVTKNETCWIVDQTDYVCSCPNGRSDYENFPTIYIDIGALVL